MRMLIFFLVAALAGAADAPSKADRLAALVEKFPPPITGPVTEKTDSVVRTCFFKYKHKVEALTEDNMGDRLAEIREALDTEIFMIEKLRLWDNEKSPTTKTARRQNEAWLRQKMRPYLLRLEALQRGR